MKIQRGDWEPLIPMRYRWPILILLAMTPLVVGSDYLLGEPPESLSAVERSAPLPLWGWGLVVIGAMILAGYALRWPRLTIAGLYASGAVLVVLGIGIGQHLINDTDGGYRGPWMYVVIGLASWWAALGYSMQVGGRDG